jgi:hypothetical protein
MGVVIEICVKYPGGRTRNRGTDMVPVFIRSTGILMNTFPPCPFPPLIIIKLNEILVLLQF